MRGFWNWPGVLNHLFFKATMVGVTGGGLLGVPQTAAAQLIPAFPSPIKPQPLPPLPAPTPLPTEPVPFATPEAPPFEAPPALPQEPITIRVQQFRFLGSTVFSESELNQVTEPFRNRPITFTELLQARSAINQLYQKQGYVTSGAFIPAHQVLSHGVVTIQIVEGRLAKIDVQGNQRLHSRYIRDRLALAENAPLKLQRLLSALQLLRLDPLIKTIKAELLAGDRPGESILSVNVVEAKMGQIQLEVDNSRSVSVGSWQRQIQGQYLNLSGWGDRLSVGYANTEGSHQVNASYTLPLNARNGTFKFSYDQTWSHVITPPFDQLDIRGVSRTYNLAYRQPILQSPREEFALEVNVGRLESNDSILGFAVPLSLGADQDGKTRITELNLVQEWTRRRNQSLFALRSELGFGFRALGTANVIPPDGQFVRWRGQTQWLQSLAPDTLLLMRGNLQVANQALVPLKQFGLGGMDTARGYAQNLSLADNALSASAEVRLPIYRQRRQGGVLLQVAPFIDVARGWSSASTNSPIGLVDAGVGLRWKWGDRWAAQLDWGVPLRSVDALNVASGLGNSRLYFSIGTQLAF